VPAGAIKIDLETEKGYAGLGDICVLAWLAEGPTPAPAPITPAAQRDRTFNARNFPASRQTQP
jgi:hypothetical protein